MPIDMPLSPPERQARIVVLISADAEWRAVRKILPDLSIEGSPFGEWSLYPVPLNGQPLLVVFLHGGWGKISAAASTQYAIDRWRPELLVNLGTCGGLRGQIERGEIILVEATLVYDIIEQMGDPVSHLDHYTTHIDLSWLSENHPLNVRRGRMVSADRDLVPEQIGHLRERFGAIAGDWESGAIAWVAGRNGVRCLILRGVTDLVDASGGDVYGDLASYQVAAYEMMKRLLGSLPGWLTAAGY